MENKFTYAQMVALLDSNKNNDAYLLDAIKTYDGDDVRLLGAKSYIALNPSIAALKLFLSSSNANVKKTRLHLYFYKIAAALVVSISIGFIVYQILNSKPAMEAYIINDSGFKVWMSAPSLSVDLINGMSYYKNKKYDEALPYFSKLPINDTALYYSGICAMHLSKLNNAELFFKQIPIASIYKNKSLYYMSLCYLFNGKEQDGLKLLQSTSFTDSVLNIKKNELLVIYKQD